MNAEKVNIGDLVKFSNGRLGTIVDISPDFGGYALVYVSGDVTFRNPTHMNLESVIKNAEVINAVGS